MATRSKSANAKCCFCGTFSFCVAFIIVLLLSYVFVIITINQSISKNLFQVFKVQAVADVGHKLRESIKTGDKDVIHKSPGLYDNIQFEQISYVVNSGDDELFMSCFWMNLKPKNESTLVLVSKPTQSSIPTMTDFKMLQIAGGFKRNTCFYDYSGNGYSTGTPSEATLYNNIDAVLNQLTTVEKIPRRKIVLYGHSLGASLSIDLASKIRGFGGEILVAPFISAFSLDIVDHILPSYIPKWVANSTLMKSYDPFRNDQKIMQITDCPFLILRGKKDQDVPFTHTQTLVNNLKQVGNENVEFTEIDANLDFSMDDTAMKLVNEQVAKYFAKYGL